MIWAIGGVRGLFDPLKRLISEILLAEEATGEAAERIVLLGDLLAPGPSPGEVLDLVGSLGEKAAALTGRDEEALIRRLAAGPWPSGDPPARRPPDSDPFPGWERTLRALSGRSLPSERDDPAGSGGGASGAPGLPSVLPKYARVLTRLKPLHVEEIDAGARRIAVTFANALPASFPEASGPGSGAGRDGGGRDGGGGVFVHARLPAPRPDPDGSGSPVPEAPAPRLFSRDPLAKLERALYRHKFSEALGRVPKHGGWWRNIHHFFTRGEPGLEAIGLGDSSGGRLVAVGLSGALLAEGYLPFMGCPAGGDWRSRTGKVEHWAVMVTGFGVPGGTGG